MRQHLPNVLLFLVLATGLVGGWWYIDKTFFPKPEVKPPAPPTPARELVGAVAGAPALGAPPADGYAALPPPVPPSRTLLLQSVTGGLYLAAELARPPAVPKPPAVKPAEPQELIALGDGSFYNQVLLTTRGGGVQQVILTRFDEASRLGLEVKQADGQPQHLRLIPGVTRPRVGLTELHNDPGLARQPDLAPGKVPADLAAALS